MEVCVTVRVRVRVGLVGLVIKSGLLRVRIIVYYHGLLLRKCNQILGITYTLIQDSIHGG
jgi:hypothetical protein